jgi:hypothetical protein
VFVNLLDGQVMVFGRINYPVLYEFVERGIVSFVPPCLDWCAVTHFMASSNYEVAASNDRPII